MECNTPATLTCQFTLRAIRCIGFVVPSTLRAVVRTRQPWVAPMTLYWAIVSQLLNCCDAAIWGKYIVHKSFALSDGPWRLHLYVYYHYSIYEFTTKMKKWHEMAKLPESFLKQINKMERSYSITSNVFRKYGDIFEQLFVSPPNEKKNCKFRWV